MKKILLIPALFLTLACYALLGEPIRTDDPASPTGQVTSGHGFVEVRLRSRDGDLPTMLAAESQKAAALGLIPVVEFDASW